MYRRLLNGQKIRQASACARTLRLQRPAAGLALSSSILAAYILWQSQNQRIHNDVALSPKIPSKQNQTEFKLIPGGLVSEIEELRTVVWGSNRYVSDMSCIYKPGFIALISSGTLVQENIDNFRVPVIAQWLDGVALRDLSIHRDHAACVDARGDVYQWGQGHSTEESRPSLTLRGKVCSTSLSLLPHH
jgi:hypothetical protein